MRATWPARLILVDFIITSAIYNFQEGLWFKSELLIK
jgi:hypothetical protein